MTPWDEPTTDPARLLARLFAGRTDAYAVDRPEGGMRPVRVGCLEHWLEGIEMHLMGSQPIGVYPLLDDGTVSWGCIDVDCHAGPLDEGLVSNIMRLLPRAGISAWEEISRSGGRHLWVFAETPVPATLMRTALLAVGQILGVKLDEVNPKQIALTGEGLGNLVRIPYPGAHSGTPGTQVVLDADGNVMALNAWVRAALRSRNGAGPLSALASLYRAPAPTTRAPESRGAITSISRYMSAALEAERRELSALGIGNRNHRLYQSALKLGRFLNQDPDAEGPITDALLSAARENGLIDEDGEPAVLATIRSGIRNGASRGS